MLAIVGGGNWAGLQAGCARLRGVGGGRLMPLMAALAALTALTALAQLL